MVWIGIFTDAEYTRKHVCILHSQRRGWLCLEGVERARELINELLIISAISLSDERRCLCVQRRDYHHSILALLHAAIGLDR